MIASGFILDPLVVIISGINWLFNNDFFIIFKDSFVRYIWFCLRIVKDSGDYDPDDDCGDPVYKHANDETIINRLRENEEIIKFE